MDVSNWGSLENVFFGSIHSVLVSVKWEPALAWMISTVILNPKSYAVLLKQLPNTCRSAAGEKRLRRLQYWLHLTFRIKMWQAVYSNLRTSPCWRDRVTCGPNVQLNHCCQDKFKPHILRRHNLVNLKHRTPPQTWGFFCDSFKQEVVTYNRWKRKCANSNVCSTDWPTPTNKKSTHPLPLLPHSQRLVGVQSSQVGAFSFWLDSGYGTVPSARPAPALLLVSQPNFLTLAFALPQPRSLEDLFH